MKIGANILKYDVSLYFTTFSWSILLVVYIVVDIFVLCALMLLIKWWRCRQLIIDLSTQRRRSCLHNIGIKETWRTGDDEAGGGSIRPWGWSSTGRFFFKIFMQNPAFWCVVSESVPSKGCSLTILEPLDQHRSNDLSSIILAVRDIVNGTQSIPEGTMIR